MVRLLFVLIFLIIILLIFWLRSKDRSNNRKSNLYKNILIITIISGILFFLVTSGRFILPQLMQIFKMALPLITKLIGI